MPYFIFKLGPARPEGGRRILRHVTTYATEAEAKEGAKANDDLDFQWLPVDPSIEPIIIAADDLHAASVELGKLLYDHPRLR